MLLFLLILFPSLLAGILLADPSLWWSFALISFFAGAYRGKIGWQSFLIGFIAIAALWGGVSAYYDTQGGTRLSQRIAQSFQFSSSLGLYVATCLIGGLISGLATLAGQKARELFWEGQSRF
jgi:hypothetical protein